MHKSSSRCGPVKQRIWRRLGTMPQLTGSKELIKDKCSKAPPSELETDNEGGRKSTYSLILCRRITVRKCGALKMKYECKLCMPCPCVMSVCLHLRKMGSGNLRVLWIDHLLPTVNLEKNKKSYAKGVYWKPVVVFAGVRRYKGGCNEVLILLDLGGCNWYGSRSPDSCLCGPLFSNTLPQVHNNNSRSPLCYMPWRHLLSSFICNKAGGKLEKDEGWAL